MEYRIEIFDENEDMYIMLKFKTITEADFTLNHLSLKSGWHANLKEIKNISIKRWD